MTSRAYIAILALAVAAFLPAIPAFAQAPAAPQQYWVYIGNGDTKGIGLFKLDVTKGTLTPAGIAAVANKPGFLNISPNQKFLFAGVTANTPAGPAGAVQSFSIDSATGKLTPINLQPSEGDEPCFVSVDPSGRNVLSANYGTATVSVLPVDASGKLSAASSVIKEAGSSIDPVRQTHAYAHSIRLDPSGKFVLVADLGLDKVFVYKYDNDKGTLTPNDPPSVSITPGEGARHFYFHPQHPDWMYLITEMGCTIHYFHWDSDRGVLAEKQKISTLPPDFKGTSTCAEILVHPGGKFLYCSNRGDDSIGEFAIDPQSGKLTLIGHVKSGGKTPRNFEIDPTGHWLLTANQDGNNACVFAIDLDTGKLTQKGDAVAITYPFCPRFLPISAK